MFMKAIFHALICKIAFPGPDMTYLIDCWTVASFDSITLVCIYTYICTVYTIANERLLLANPSFTRGVVRFRPRASPWKWSRLYHTIFFLDASWYRHIKAEIIAAVAESQLDVLQLGFVCRLDWERKAVSIWVSLSAVPEVRRECTSSHFHADSFIRRCQHKIRR